MSATYTAYITWNVWETEWKGTVETLAELFNVALAEFVDERLGWTQVYLFEVFGSTENVSRFMKKISSEDRKRKYIKYDDYVELT